MVGYSESCWCGKGSIDQLRGTHLYKGEIHGRYLPSVESNDTAALSPQKRLKPSTTHVAKPGSKESGK